MIVGSAENVPVGILGSQITILNPTLVQSGHLNHINHHPHHNQAFPLRFPTRIIPIYLVHRPSNDVPYATLEEELIGDFVKYSVRDGKEINLKRSDSEAGQKCCAFQHWVYDKTDGNLLVTDMQGQGH